MYVAITSNSILFLGRSREINTGPDDEAQNQHCGVSRPGPALPQTVRQCLQPTLWLRQNSGGPQRATQERNCLRVNFLFFCISLIHVLWFLNHKLKRVPLLKAQTECHYNFLVWFEKKMNSFANKNESFLLIIINIIYTL